MLKTSRGSSLPVTLYIVIGVLFGLSGAIWLIHAVISGSVMAYVAALVFLLASTLWLLGGGIRRRRRR